MSRALTNLLGMLITIAAGTYFFITYCSSCHAESEAVAEPVVESVIPSPTRYGFALQGADPGIESEANFKFNFSGSTILNPADSLLNSVIGQMAGYMGNSDSLNLFVNGLYHPDETNTSAFPDLGFARAQAVKDYLRSRGIDISRMRIEGTADSTMVADGDILYGPVKFHLETIEANSADELEAMATKLRDEPLVLNFNTAEAAINLTSAQRSKFLTLINYLDRVPDAVCLVTGHTDNTGNPETNVGLGMERANFARDYLIANGIGTDRIEVKSDGDTNPIASNETEAGRAQNRRTVISLK